MDYCASCGRMLVSGTKKCPLCGFSESEKKNGGSVFDILDDMDVSFGHISSDNPDSHICQNDIIENKRLCKNEDGSFGHISSDNSDSIIKQQRKEYVEEVLEKARAKNSFDRQTEEKYRLNALVLFPDRSCQKSNNSVRTKASSKTLLIFTAIVIFVILQSFNTFQYLILMFLKFMFRAVLGQ